MLPSVSFRSSAVRGAGLRLAPVLLVGLIAATLWVHRFEIAQPTGRPLGPHIDTYMYFYPAAAFAHEELGQGRLPLWNPYQMAGQPTLGLHVPAVLYPPNLLLHWLFPPRVAMPAHAVLHVFLAGFLIWLFVGRLGLGAAARLVAAVSFMLCNTLLVGLYMPPFLSTPVWLPAMLWSVHGLASEGRLRWALALGGSLGLAFLGGHAQGFVYAVQFSALYGLFALVFVASRGGRLRVVGLACVAGVLAFALAAPQLLPALELARDSVRGLEGLSYPQAAFTSLRRSMVWQGWLGAFAPKQGLQSAVQPVLLLPLAMCGVFSRRLRPHWVFFSLLFALVAELIIGSWSPLFRYYYELPLGDLFRAPHRMAFVYSLCGAVLAGIGTQVLVERLQRSRLPVSVPLALGVLLVAGVGIDRYARTDFPFPHPVVGEPFAGAPPALLEFLRWRPGLERTFLERIRFFDPQALRKAGSIQRAFFAVDYEPNMPGDYARFLGLTEEPLWHGAMDVVPPVLGSAVEPRRLDVMSVRHYAVAEPAWATTAQRLRTVAGGEAHDLGGVSVFERRSAVPRLYAVRDVRSVPDLEAALQALDEPGFDPRSQAVVIGSDEAVGSVPRPASAQRPDIVVLEGYAPQRVEARVDCAVRCLVVLTDLHYPGWKLRVDGGERPIERANGIFRGAWLEPGEHRLVYAYEPESFRAGALLSSVAVLGVAGAMAYSGLRSRRGS